MTLTHSLRSLLIGRAAQPGDIQWLSYHIPKTAGSSLRLMFYKAFGRSSVCGVYRPDDARMLGQGKVIHIPSRTRIIHGHFKPHPQHSVIYPNATSMVWVRDPVERIWSLVGHLLDLKSKHPHYETLYNLYISKGIDSQADIVERIIKEESIPYMVNAYTRFFSSLDIHKISFVGSVHNFSSSVNRLNKQFNLTLKPIHRNSRTKSSVPNSLGKLKRFMEHEYSLVDSYL